MVFLRPRILRDAVTEYAISSEKYNYLRSEQLRMRENRELKYRGELMPVLPELGSAPASQLQVEPAPAEGGDGR